MRQFLKSLGFNIEPDFDDLMGMMKAAQQVRRMTRRLQISLRVQRPSP